MSKLFNQIPNPKKGIIGHRGAAGIAPENTLAGFIKAAELGINWIEFDIQRCASGEWVVIHDKTLDRTTNGQGLVSEVPYEILKTLDAGSWFNGQFNQERIPLLKDALTCLIDLNVHPNIEIKGAANNKKEMAQNFLSQLESSWPKSLTYPLVSSFDLELLIILRKLNPNLPLGFIIKEEPTMGVKAVLRYQLNTLHCHQRAFQMLSLLSTIAEQIPLLIYTINAFQRVQTFLQAGATAVFSDLTNNFASQLKN